MYICTRKQKEKIIFELANKFRNAIEIARDKGCFRHDISFHKFPLGCCGDASDLLAQYLTKHGIDTLNVCGNYYYDDPNIGAQSHAWLEYKDIIIDITGDQFKHYPEFLNYNIPVYVGERDKMHELFEVSSMDIHKAGIYIDPCSPLNIRLMNLYNIIKSYLG